MQRVMRELLIGILVCGLIFSGFVGCGEKEEDIGQPPELPPDASMTMDFSLFGGGSMAPGVLFPGTNFLNAAVRVVLLNAAVIVVMTPSVSTFIAARTVEPVHQDDGSWLWSYTINIGNHEVAANLTGRLENAQTVWSMKVTDDSFDSPLDDFEWYTGKCSLDNTSGDWLFFDYKTPDEGNRLATMEWSVEDKTKSELVFSNIDERSENFGDTLLYSIDGTTALISFYDDSKDITAEITWHTITTAGSIQAPDYNNGERAYWDENGQNYTP